MNTPPSRPSPAGAAGPAAPAGAPGAAGTGIQLTGGAAILAPVSAFQNGVPGNALVLLPIQPNGTPLEKKVIDGPVALTMDEVWKLLGFNGPAVQVQDEQGRPIAIGLEDLLAGLEKHWNDAGEDLSRGRIFAQELLKYSRFEKAEKVLGKIVALGGDGEDWLGLGVSQLAQKKLDKAEATLKGAQNLLKESPFPSLQLAKVMKEKGDRKAERECAERAIQIDNNSVDAWAYLANAIKGERRRRGDGEAGRGAGERAGERQVRRAVHRASGLLRREREGREGARHRHRAGQEGRRAQPGRRARPPLPVRPLRTGRQGRRGGQAARPARGDDAPRRPRRSQLLRGALPAP